MKMSFRFAFKTSFGHLQDVLTRCLACLGKTSLRHLVDVFLQTGLVFHFTTPLSAAYRGVFRAWKSKGAFFAKILDGFKLQIFLQKKLYRRYFTGLKIGFWLMA